MWKFTDGIQWKPTTLKDVRFQTTNENYHTNFAANNCILSPEEESNIKQELKDIIDSPAFDLPYTLENFSF
jgi:hypothetical protein